MGTVKVNIEVGDPQGRHFKTQPVALPELLSGRCRRAETARNRTLLKS